MVTPALRRATALLALLLLLPAGCSSGGAGGDGTRGGGAQPSPAATGRATRPAPRANEDFEWYQQAWARFVAEDPTWPSDRDAWLAKGGAAPYVLSENLFRYFWSSSKARRRDRIGRVSNEVKFIGEPAVAYFTKVLVTDRWELKEPLTVEVFNPDNPNRPLKKTFTHYDVDDVTRQHATYVLAAIGEPAVPMLASPEVLGSSVPSARRYGAYALGAIGSDPAVQALGRMLRSSPDWRDRGAAAKGLGLAFRKNPAARPLLEQALGDPDDFVRRKAQEGLDGETRIEF
jgi:hypothetical protein